MADESFRVLLDQVLSGDEESARRLVDEYGPPLLRAVRKRLPPRLRPRFDSLDFAQDVWASFFADLPYGRTFGGPNDLAAFLARVARNKVLGAVRCHLIAGRQNVHVERPLDAGDGRQADQLAARVPTPSVAAMSREEWERLLRSQPPVYRRILLLVRAGKTPAEAAREVGVSERTARRLVNRVLPGLES